MKYKHIVFDIDGKALNSFNSSRLFGIISVILAKHPIVL